MTTIEVKIDDRARLVTAVLAASDWPDEEQKQLTHAVHPHAKQTRQFVQKYKYHQAIRGVNEALLNGVTLEELFSTAVRCAWPTFEPAEPLPHLLKIERWARSLADFEHDTDIATTLWVQYQDVWQAAVDALQRIFADGRVASFLDRLTQMTNPQMVIMPNLVYPALTAVLATTQDTLYLLLPPPKAVGESPPWPYDEDPPTVVTTVCQHLSIRLMADRLAALERAQRELFRHAATTLCLETAFDEFEAQAYQLRIKKTGNLPTLPVVTDQLRRYLNGDLAELVDIFEE
ncbi:MAG TPA: hypothetical protein PLD25_26255 [Chloroflexota bacterium]|nr:hypothetical protein [Chloroflexota bacterium]HUM70816.1 hypothetical protein [Chloroflexota bacterium]